MTDKRLVALADILGFKDTIRTTPLQRIVDDYFGFLRKSLQRTLKVATSSETTDAFEDLKARAGIGIEWFSDTIALYTLTDDDESTTHLIQTVTWLVFENMFYAPTRLRVAIDYDELHASKDAGQLVGKAIVGAHELEKAQEWSGGALTTSAIARLPEAARHYTTEYPIPLKPSASVKTTTAINWTLGLHPGFAVQHGDDQHTRADIITKRENTIAFHNAVCPTCKRR